jgi:hypothetical protein
MKKFLFSIGIAVFLTVVPGAFATSVSCTGFSSQLNTVSLGNGSAATGDFGSLCVTLSGTTATFTFTPNTAAGYYLVDGNIADVNLATSTFSTGTFTNDIQSGSNTPSFDGSGNVSMFGTLSETTDNANASSLVSLFSYTLTSASFTNVNSILSFNSQGFDAAAHILCSGCAGTGLTNGLTYFVGEGAVATPEPSSLVWIVGAGIIGAFFVSRRKKLPPASQQ